MPPATKAATRKERPIRRSSLPMRIKLMPSRILILRLHHPKPIPPKLPRLGKSKYYADDDRASRHYFRGAKRRRFA
jgi:hypothetical protein